MSRSKGSGRKRRRRDAGQRADLAVMFVHGIGRQTLRHTLEAFGNPIIESLAQRFPGEVEEVACKHCSLEFEHSHVCVRSKSFILAECYWDDLVGAIDHEAYNSWIRAVAPQLVLWQMTSSAAGGFWRRWDSRARYSPVAWFSWACALWWGILLRGFFGVFSSISAGSLLQLYPSSDGQKGMTRLEHVVAETLGDAYAFVHEPADGGELRARFWSVYSRLHRSSRRIAVVAHSQGAALAHASLQGGKPQDSPELLVGVGSGLGPLGASRGSAGSNLAMVIRVAVVTLVAAMWIALSYSLALVLAFVVEAVLLYLRLLGVAALSLLQLLLALSSRDSQTVGELAIGWWELLKALPVAARNWGEVLVQYGTEFAVASLLLSVVLATTRRNLGAPSLAKSDAMRIPGLDRSNWYEFYSPLDPVSVGTPTNRCATAVRVDNGTGWAFWREHGAYFDRTSPVVPHVTALLAQVVGLENPRPGGPSPKSGRMRPLLVELVATVAWLILYLFVVRSP